MMFFQNKYKIFIWIMYKGFFFFSYSNCYQIFKIKKKKLFQSYIIKCIQT